MSLTCKHEGGIALNYADVKYPDTANGPGVRVSLFLSGCRHHCKDCFNPETWDFCYGKEFDEEVKTQIFSILEKSYVHGLTILGGEPMEPENQKPLFDFLHCVKKQFPDKTIWIYSGFTYEELLGEKESRGFTEYSRKILSLSDVLVDGLFESSLKDVRLKFRGSSNQRIINLQKSLKTNNVNLWV